MSKTLVLGALAAVAVVGCVALMVASAPQYSDTPDELVDTPADQLAIKMSIVKAKKNDVKGYLRKGDSLSGMPLDFGMGKGSDKTELGHKCESACKKDMKCAAYTYHPEQGVCYLKSKVRPGLRGDSCDGDSCWYFGVL